MVRSDPADETAGPRPVTITAAAGLLFVHAVLVLLTALVLVGLYRGRLHVDGAFVGAVMITVVLVGLRVWFALALLAGRAWAAVAAAVVESVTVFEGLAGAAVRGLFGRGLLGVVIGVAVLVLLLLPVSRRWLLAPR